MSNPPEDPADASRAERPTSAFRRITGAFNGTLLYSASLLALSQVNFGMDQSAFNNTQAMAPFVKKFGVYDPKTQGYVIEPYFLSLLNSLTYIGFAVGLVFGSFVSRKFGRRMSLFAMCGWGIIGATILVTSRNRGQMLAGRIVAYVYIGMELAVVPVLQSEMTPKFVRGFVVGTYQSGVLLGQLLMAVICRGTSSIKSDNSWRIPLGLFFIIPAFVGVGVWFIPESPRWLLVKDRPDEAFSALQRLRKGKFSDEEIQDEFRELRSTLDLAVDKGSFMEIFKHINLKRTLIVVGVNVFLQITGQNFVNVYGTVFINSLGTVNPFTMSCVNYTVNIVFTVITQVLTDWTGRKPLLILGAAIQTASLFTMGGLGTVKNPSLSIKKGITAMVTVFGVGFQLGWAPLSHVIAAEIPTSRLRDQTYAFGAAFNVVIQFAVSFSVPYLLNAPYANLHSKVGFIFGAFAFCAVVFSYMGVPECGGKSLEEIDELFLERVPIRKFGKTHVSLPEPPQEESKISVTHKE